MGLVWVWVWFGLVGLGLAFAFVGIAFVGFAFVGFALVPQVSSLQGRLQHPEACCPHSSNDNPAANNAGLQTGSDQWPRRQHEPCHRYLASSASGRAPGCPRRDQRPDRRLGGSSHQAGAGVPWGSEPEPQRLWPSHRQRQPLAGQHPQE